MEYPEIERVELDCQVSSLSLPIIYMLIRCMLTRLTKWVYNQTGYALRPIRGMEIYILIEMYINMVYPCRFIEKNEE